MATEKKITSRIQQKHDVAANWAKATNFIPKKGEIIIYDAEYNASGEETQAVRFKIGDGSKTVNNLPFAVIDYNSDIEALKQKVANNSTAIGALQENTVPKTRKINNKALSSDITLGAADVGVNETTFPGLKKTGTITGINMNGASKGTSGVVDIGTVLTDASKFATAAQGSNADSALSKANANATEISNIKNGTNGTKVKYAEHADAADSATSASTATKATEAMNVTENIKGHAIADIFETNGTTVKKATSAGTADKVANMIDIGAATPTDPTTIRWSSFNGSSGLSVSFQQGDFLGEDGGHDHGIYKRYIQLSPTGITAGKYNNVTVDKKGRVTKGENVNYLTSHQSIKKLNTNNTLPYDVDSNESITGEGTINLHKIAKTGLYDDLRNKPSNATQSTPGLMSAADKGKLDGIATGANAYVLPSANSDRLGGIKISFSNGVLTITT